MGSCEKSNLPKFYLNLKSYNLAGNSNPYTPAVNLVFVDEALKWCEKKGCKHFMGHNKHKLAMSNVTKALNLKLFADEKYLSRQLLQ